MSRVSIIIQERDFYGQYSDSDDDDNNSSFANDMVLTQGVYITLDLALEDALLEVQSVIYSDESRLPEPYVFEERHHTLESGASGNTEYDIVLTVLTGLASGVGVELIKSLGSRIFKQGPMSKEDALSRCRAYLIKETHLPRRVFELIYSEDKNNYFVFMFREKSTDGKYYVRMSKEFEVIEYRVYGAGFIPEEDA